ncbi:GNAT family N-acetyltransferase [Ciceribacter azotifigens]|uniref:GNAT family N-acetyltransferase n=1 Tax=Ciceribacter azotifigens TaxID=2069303 RepID=UPI003A89D532
MIEFRPYKDGDELAITELFAKVFGRPMSTSYWRWRFLQHPSSDPMIMLAFDGETLVGNYAASQAPLSLAGEVFPACLSMTTMTHPDWRGQKLFERTAEALYETLPSRGKFAIYGFPNSVSHTLFRSKVGWADYCDVATLVLETDKLFKLPIADSAVKQVENVDERFGLFNAKVAAGLPIVAHRSTEILSWRVDRNPDNTYARFVLEEGDEIAGYAITKAYGTEMLDLVELRCADTAVTRALINAVTAHAVAENRTRIATWCLPMDVHRVPLEMAGFNATAPVTYFGGRTFTTLPADLTDSRLWRLSMLDSDLY